jgi:hypothetical protein
VATYGAAAKGKVRRPPVCDRGAGEHHARLHGHASTCARRGGECPTTERAEASHTQALTCSVDIWPRWMSLVESEIETQHRNITARLHRLQVSLCRTRDTVLSAMWLLCAPKRNPAQRAHPAPSYTQRYLAKCVCMWVPMGQGLCSTRIERAGRLCRSRGSSQDCKAIISTGKWRVCIITCHPLL